MVGAENRQKLARQALDAVGTRDEGLIGEVEEKTVVHHAGNALSQ